MLLSRCSKANSAFFMTPYFPFSAVVASAHLITVLMKFYWLQRHTVIPIKLSQEWTVKLCRMPCMLSVLALLLGTSLSVNMVLELRY